MFRPYNLRSTSQAPHALAASRVRASAPALPAMNVRAQTDSLSQHTDTQPPRAGTRAASAPSPGAGHRTPAAPAVNAAPVAPLPTFRRDTGRPSLHDHLAAAPGVDPAQGTRHVPRLPTVACSRAPLLVPARRQTATPPDDPNFELLTARAMQEHPLQSSAQNRQSSAAQTRPIYAPLGRARLGLWVGQPGANLPASPHHAGERPDWHSSSRGRPSAPWACNPAHGARGGQNILTLAHSRSLASPSAHRLAPALPQFRQSLDLEPAPLDSDNDPDSDPDFTARDQAPHHPTSAPARSRAPPDAAATLPFVHNSNDFASAWVPGQRVLDVINPDFLGNTDAVSPSSHQAPQSRFDQRAPGCTIRLTRQQRHSATPALRQGRPATSIPPTGEPTPAGKISTTPDMDPPPGKRPRHPFIPALPRKRPWSPNGHDSADTPCQRHTISRASPLDPSHGVSTVVRVLDDPATATATARRPRQRSQQSRDQLPDAINPPFRPPRPSTPAHRCSPSNVRDAADPAVSLDPNLVPVPAPSMLHVHRQPGPDHHTCAIDLPPPATLCSNANNTKPASPYPVLYPGGPLADATSFVQLCISQGLPVAVHGYCDILYQAHTYWPEPLSPAAQREGCAALLWASAYLYSGQSETQWDRLPYPMQDTLLRLYCLPPNPSASLWPPLADAIRRHSPFRYILPPPTTPPPPYVPPPAPLPPALRAPGPQLPFKPPVPLFTTICAPHSHLGASGQSSAAPSGSRVARLRNFTGRPCSPAIIGDDIGIPMPIVPTCCACASSLLAGRHRVWECPLNYFAKFQTCPGFLPNGAKDPAAWNSSRNNLLPSTRAQWKSFINMHALKMARDALGDIAF